MVVITVDSRIRIESVVAPELRAELEELFTHDNPDKRQVERFEAALASKGGKRNKRLYAMMKAAQKAPDQIATWRDEGGKLSLPRGGMARLVSVLSDHRERYRLIDKRTDGDPTLWAVHDSAAPELRDYQVELVESAIREETCLWRSPTGSGKTRAVQALAHRLELPTLVVVWTGNLFKQWVADCERVLGMDRRDIGTIGEGSVRLGSITIGMQQSLARRLEEPEGEALASKFGIVIGEEVDRFAASTFLKVIDRFPARYRVGISDDERRKDKKDFLIYDQFGDVAAKVSRKKLIDEGHILGVEVRMLPTDFAPPWYELVPEPQRPMVHDKLVEAMIDDSARNAIALDIAQREVWAAGEQLIFFSSRVDHVRRLEAESLDRFARARRIRTGLLLGGVEYRNDFERTRAGLLDGSVRLAAGTYKAIAYGTNLPSVARGIATTPIHNNRAIARQTMGRLCRTHEGKSDAVLYVLWDKEIFGKQPLVNFIRWAQRVRVLEGGEWVEGREVLNRWEEDESNAALGSEATQRELF